jgi:hypothetical protein
MIIQVDEKIKKEDILFELIEKNKILEHNIMKLYGIKYIVKNKDNKKYK